MDSINRRLLSSYRHKSEAYSSTQLLGVPVSTWVFATLFFMALMVIVTLVYNWPTIKRWKLVHTCNYVWLSQIFPKKLGMTVCLWRNHSKMRVQWVQWGLVCSRPFGWITWNFLFVQLYSLKEMNTQISQWVEFEKPWNTVKESVFLPQISWFFHRYLWFLPTDTVMFVTKLVSLRKVQLSSLHRTTKKRKNYLLRNIKHF